MKNTLLKGTTDENNAWLLPSGMLSVDVEKKALRLSDGQTQGGFEILGVRAYEPPVGPGPELLIAGNTDSGLYGEVTSSEFITYSDLASLVGVSAGTLINNAESSWVKVSHFGKILIIAKKPIRSGISWNQINAAGAVHGTEVTIGSYRYSVRLMRVSDTDPESGAGGELVNIWRPLRDGTLASYTETALGGGGTSSSPRWPWAVETVSSNSNSRMRYGGSTAVGYNTGSNATDSYATSTASYNSWRPVLELIQ